MLFLIRAAVVIGGLSYLAMLRDSPDPALSLAAVPAQALPTQAAVVHSLAVQAQPGPALATVWNGMPADARERMVRDGTDAFVRRLGMQRSPSGDTLADTDRRPPWRGIAPP